MASKTYTTAEAAKQIGVSRQGLYNWIDEGKVAAPKAITLGGRTMRMWTAADIAKVRKFKGTLKVGRPKTKH
jgi:excisionase family DNA binding protein